MSHYISKHYGCNHFCSDSAFKRYNRYHCGSDIIFNFGGSTHCCGNNGGSVGFWGGFGAGIGMGLSNILMGGLNMLGGWLGLGGGMNFGGGYNMGGWNLGNMGGYNIGWNGGSGYNNGYNGGNNGNNRGVGRNSSDEVRTEGQNGNIENIDNPKIAEISTKIKELAAKGNPTREEIEAIEKEINEAIKNTDSIQLNDDLEIYNNLKAWLNSLKKPEMGLDSGANGANGAGGATGADGTGAGGANGATGAGQNPNGAGGATGAGEVLVDGKPVKIEDFIKTLTPDANGVKQVEKLSEDAIKGLDKKLATDILSKLGYIDDDGIGKLSGSYKVLLLLKQSGVTVQVENRNDSPDQWIKGPITEVTNTDGKLSYVVDCTNESTATIKGKYRFKATDNTNKEFRCSAADEDTLNRVNIKDIELIWEKEKEPLKNKTAQVLVSRK